jgi:hypothetical protein
MDAAGDYNVDPKTGVLLRGAYTVENVEFHLPTDTAKATLSQHFELLGSQGILLRQSVPPVTPAP